MGSGVDAGVRTGIGRIRAEWLVLFLWFGLGICGFASDERPPNEFGFSGPEIFPVDIGITQLRAADVNGDGLTDLLVVNNARSKINVLINRPPDQQALPEDVATGQSELNELPPDARFKIDSIASEKRIAGLIVHDLNGDDRPDLAYFGDPRELVVQYNQGDDGWSQVRRWPLTDGLMNPNALTVGDLNADGRADLLLLAEKHIYLLRQNPDGLLAEPVKLPYIGSLKSIQILDLNGDSNDDLLMVNWDSPNPVRVRIQDEPGRLGPEIHFTLPPIRSYWADDLDGDGQTELMSIAKNSGRVQLSHVRVRPADTLAAGLQQGQIMLHALENTGKSRRGRCWADVSKDGLPDLLVSEPESGLVSLYTQQPGGILAVPQRFPTLTGVTDMAAGDWDGDGNLEIFLLSADERNVGVTCLTDEGRIGFPEILPIDGRPLALAAGSLSAGDESAAPLAFLVVAGEDARFLEWHDPSGLVGRQKLNENFKSNPDVMLIHDINQDGLNDLIVSIPYEKLKLLVQVDGGTFEELDVAPPGGTSGPSWMSAADVDGDGRLELLLAQRNFIRAVVLEIPENGRERSSASFRVKEQINGVSGNSRIVAAAALPVDDRKTPVIFLLDSERKSLALCDRDASNTWQIVKEIVLPIADFTELETVALGGGRPNSLAFSGLNVLGTMRFEGDVWELVERDGYETSIRNGFLQDVISGDLNQDRVKDLVFLETAENHIDIVSFEPPHHLAPANRWRVFEERTFRSRRREVPEPREALVVDVTGDGRNDLVVLVHDRILLYPQE